MTARVAKLASSTKSFAGLIGTRSMNASHAWNKMTDIGKSFKEMMIIVKLRIVGIVLVSVGVRRRRRHTKSLSVEFSIVVVDVH
jgi:hypothetical protein